MYKADVERICNPHAEAARKTEQRKIRKMLLVIVAMLVGVLVGMLLWLLNVPGGAAMVVASNLFLCAAAFMAGRLWEISK